MKISKGLRITLIILVVLVAIILAGPRMPKPVFNPELPDMHYTPREVAELVAQENHDSLNIRPGNGSILHWANDSAPAMTKYVLLYLHGFSASPMEGFPTHLNLAMEFGMNAYIPRLAEHGLETDEPLLHMTPDSLWESAKNALVIARSMGRKVILMGTSTGGTLALKMAADYPNLIDALILYSPNIRIADKSSVLLARHWGLQIGRLILGSKYRTVEMSDDEKPYWYTKYRIEALVYLQQMLENTMKAETFQAVHQPVFTGYYYKDENHQDNVVSVTAIRWMLDNLGTDPSQVESVAFDDAGTHVIGCSLTNPHWDEVFNATEKFMKNILSL
ncbi:MAG: alpha/beta hydrolase [Bacteroidales bacterium]|nr:alpha/beta hydrolase [Bacteroidales bacterium]